ncbi:chromosome transmission fidelity protein 8 homolog [Temnothorax curvispinosus]|uniref:Chromosome transmission fidelity protein 8 homolog n=2 Tax=Temnothorax TaxID=300110 RepID=A0A6J1Q553_9HYME|nr:chromosome transmission fidelity protein 8 homolog [Temnothorax curvispinosus]XP_024876566.1 chromosome transmission fidelity protein 8 homolog [Temnothorax curvispinosus]XP_024876567.1 chromosome transmission fidelity protein 8 homolog [Temnothorax curvispinosus]TGZ47177.1 Chromosome transmission fidelity protein 8-like protein [Temnothorax longispinosus]
MIVPIKRDGYVDTWAIVDLQGDLKFERIDNPDDQLIGDLHFTKAGVPILIIGIHVLHGKEITLDKPLIVLERHRNTRDEAIEGEAAAKTEYFVKAIVKKKLLFKSRPKPIVTNVPKPC